MIDLERYFVDAKIRKNKRMENAVDANDKCLAFTKECADNFINKFSFLAKYGFVLGLRKSSSFKKTCNYNLQEYFIHIENPKHNYETNVYFPMEQIQNGECDFCSRSLDPTHASAIYEEYTYANGAMTLATIFG